MNLSSVTQQLLYITKGAGGFLFNSFLFFCAYLRFMDLLNQLEYIYAVHFFGAASEFPEVCAAGNRSLWLCKLYKYMHFKHTLLCWMSFWNTHAHVLAVPVAVALASVSQRHAGQGCIRICGGVVCVSAVEFFCV